PVVTTASSFPPRTTVVLVRLAQRTAAGSSARGCSPDRRWSQTSTSRRVHRRLWRCEREGHDGRRPDGPGETAAGPLLKPSFACLIAFELAGFQFSQGRCRATEKWVTRRNWGTTSV
ncbi:hypothetical protein V8D89_013370, partial [Ganoderma adspersum]